MTPLWRDARIQGRAGWKDRPFTRGDLVSNLVSILSSRQPHSSETQSRVNLLLETEEDAAEYEKVTTVQCSCQTSSRVHVTQSDRSRSARACAVPHHTDTGFIIEISNKLSCGGPCEGKNSKHMVKKVS